MHRIGRVFFDKNWIIVFTSNHWDEFWQYNAKTENNMENIRTSFYSYPNLRICLAWMVEREQQHAVVQTADDTFSYWKSIDAFKQRWPGILPSQIPIKIMSGLSRGRCCFMWIHEPSIQLNCVRAKRNADRSVCSSAWQQREHFGASGSYLRVFNILTLLFGGSNRQLFIACCRQR